MPLVSFKTPWKNSSSTPVPTKKNGFGWWRPQLQGNAPQLWHILRQTTVYAKVARIGGIEFPTESEADSPCQLKFYGSAYTYMISQRQTIGVHI